MLMFLVKWFLFGAIFNLIYYFFKWDHFVVKVTLMNINEEQDSFNDFSDEEVNDSLKDRLENYENEVEHNLYTSALDLLVYPLYILSVLVAVFDYHLHKKEDL